MEIKEIWNLNIDFYVILGSGLVEHYNSTTEFGKENSDNFQDILTLIRS